MSTAKLGWKLSFGALGGKLGADWERDRRDTLFLMGSIGTCMLTHITHLPFWVSTAFAIVFFWRLGLVFSGRQLPGTMLRLLAAFAAALGVYAQYNTLFGRDAGVALLVLFLGLKLMEMKAKRDLFVVIFLCMFLLLLSFLYSQSIFSAVLATFALLTLVATLMSMQFGYHEAPLGKRFKLSAGLLARSLPIAIVLFILFPRIEQPLWRMPNDAQSGTTGLGDQMSPGNISDLSESEEIAFRVRFANALPEKENLYWRGPVLSVFDGRTWTQNRLARPGNVKIEQPDGVTPLTYTVTIEANGRNYLPALEHPISVPMVRDRPATVLPDLQLVMPDILSERLRYTVTSHPNIRYGLDETRQSLSPWLELPASFNPRTLQLALEWRNEENDPEALVKRALNWIKRDPFFYTLQPPTYGRHIVDEFLFDKRRGYCEHYSQAFVVLMRALDIPARVVTGYQGGDLNPIDDYVVVRQKNAHAWAEVWISGKGWLRVDPTAAIAPERIEKQSGQRLGSQLRLDESNGASLTNRIRMQLEALTNGWNQWLLNYDRSKQRNLLGWLGLDPDDWQQLVGLLAVLLGVILGIVAVVTLRPRGKPDPVESIFQEALRRLQNHGIERTKADTAIKLATKVNKSAPNLAPAFNEIVRTYNQLRYSGQKPDAEQIKQFRDLVRRLA